MNEQIKIDDTYTYEFDNGAVSLLRHEERWIGEGSLTITQAPKAWIAAANEIADLRTTVESLTRQIEKLNRVNAYLESRTIQEPS